MRGVDQRDMRESLRIVADLPARLRVVLLGEEADIVAQLEQPLKERTGVITPTLQDIVVGQPKAAGEKGAFIPG
jgi:hypothetical protein